MFNRAKKWGINTYNRYFANKRKNTTNKTEATKTELSIKQKIKENANKIFISKDIQLPEKVEIRLQDSIYVEARDIGIFYAELKEFRKK
jgi:uncharacterized protein with PIN domain